MNTTTTTNQGVAGREGFPGTGDHIHVWHSQFKRPAQPEIAEYRWCGVCGREEKVHRSGR